jgi:ankyrin repeat protein
MLHKDPGAVKRPETPTLNSFRPLHWAVAAANVGACEAIVAAGADVNTIGANQNTALHVAVRAPTPDIRVIRWLAAHGANLNAKEKLKGHTPLHMAILRLSPELTTLLVGLGADIGSVDADGDTALHRLAQVQLDPTQSMMRCAQILFDHGVVIDKRDNQGSTALHYAVTLGAAELVAALVERGADVNLRDNVGRSSLDLALGIRALSQAQIVRNLCDHGADLSRMGTNQRAVVESLLNESRP